MWLDAKEWPRRCSSTPGPGPQRKDATVDKRILAQGTQQSSIDQEHEGSEERTCFYCLEGWVFLGSLGHDGEEIVEVLRCRRCTGARWTGR